MKIGVLYYVSSTAAAKIANEQNYPWLETLSAKTGIPMEVTDLDHIEDYDLLFHFIGGGGTESLFLEHVDQYPQPIFLLTTGANNSLAASMEILSYLRSRNIPSEILHGSDAFVAERIETLTKVFRAKKRMRQMKFARVGKPSDWLIASEVDAKESYEKNGIAIIDVSMEEFLEEIAKNQYEENEYTKLIKQKEFAKEEIEKALCIYGALRRIVDRYELDGVTVRCFDLLDTVHSTGCAALAILNAEGIYASCEGDVPALISMALLGELTGQTVFMANPSWIQVEENKIVFAHCTLPISMPKDFTIMTHFESQIGVAFRGVIPEGRVTVFKTDGLMNRYFVSGADLLENLSEYNLCRTQIRLHLDESVSYFLTNSIGNHHLIVQGDYSKLLKEYFNW